MPTSARKSSLGASRRGPQKAHIPYRGDNPEVGKKTGVAVQHVERKSDGFEPFEEVLQQADRRTPPKPKGGRRKSSLAANNTLREDDEDGEMSMELDDSPLRYFSSIRPPSTPSNLNRLNPAPSSSRAVARSNSSNVDFDRIPSPRPRTAANTQARNTSGPGPSRLSKSIIAAEEDDDDDDGGGFDDFGPQEADYNDDEQQDDDGDDGGEANQSTMTPSRFRQMDQEEDDDEDSQPEEEEQEEELQPITKSKGKGKQKARAPDPPSEDVDTIEDDIARGLEEAEMEQHSDDDEQRQESVQDEEEEEEEEEEEAPRSRKKVKIAAEKPERPKRKSAGKKERPYVEGIRKSSRHHIAPLEWWRGEKMIYGKPTSAHNSPILVPPIKEIFRIPKEDPEPLGTKRRRGASRSKSVKPEEGKTNVKEIVKVVENPEEGWDDKTESSCTVLSYETREEIQRRIAWTAKMVAPKMAANNDWSFDKIFGDGEFIAAGQLIIPPRGRKPSKATKDNTYIFYVIEGAVNLKVHDTSLILATGGMFMVPRGNTYFIENISNRDAKLFFTQARKVAASEEELRARAEVLAAQQRERAERRSILRSSSADGHLSGLGRSSSARPPPTGQANGAAKRAQSTRI